MAFNEAEYEKQGEVCQVMYLAYKDCEFEGNVFPRKDGGFDLYLMRDNSILECLEIEVITWLRKQAEAQGGDLVFVERFSTPKNVRDMKNQVETRFAAWLQSNLRLPSGGKFKARWEEGLRPCV